MDASLPSTVARIETSVAKVRLQFRPDLAPKEKESESATAAAVTEGAAVGQQQSQGLSLIFAKQQVNLFVDLETSSFENRVENAQLFS